MFLLHGARDVFPYGGSHLTCSRSCTHLLRDKHTVYYDIAQA